MSKKGNALEECARSTENPGEEVKLMILGRDSRLITSKKS